MTPRQAVDQFIPYIAMERPLSTSTVDHYSRTLTRFVDYLDAAGMVDVAAIPHATYRAYVGHLQDHGATPNTRRQAVYTLRAFLRYLAYEGILPEYIGDILQAPRCEQRLPRVLSVETVGILIESITGNDQLAQRDRAILETLYAGGFRVSELCGLRLGDLHPDAKDGFARVVGKGDKERRVVLGDAAWRALIVWIRDGRNQWRPVGRYAKDTHVFVNANGQPMDKQQVEKVVRRRADAAGLAGIRVYPHLFRHCCATHLLEGGADLRVVQEQLGHADIATTATYTHVSAKHKRETFTAAHPRARTVRRHTETPPEHAAKVDAWDAARREKERARLRERARRKAAEKQATKTEGAPHADT